MFRVWAEPRPEAAPVASPPPAPQLCRRSHFSVCSPLVAFQNLCSVSPLIPPSQSPSLVRTERACLTHGSQRSLALCCPCGALPHSAIFTSPLASAQTAQDAGPHWGTGHAPLSLGSCRPELLGPSCHSQGGPGPRGVSDDCSAAWAGAASIPHPGL